MDLHVEAPVPRSTIADRLADARSERFVGRRDELALFDEALRPGSPCAVVYLHGPGGVGKSALLHAFADRARAAWAQPVLVDGRDVEPAPSHFLAACGVGPGGAGAGLADAQILPSAPPGSRPVLLVDAFERLEPIETWLRRTLLPQLPAQALVVIASRRPPSNGWRADPGWTALMQVVGLTNLPPGDVRTYLRAARVREDTHDEIVAATQGYPLALALLAEVANRRPPGHDLDLFRAPDLVRPLLGHLVEDLPSPDHRVALDTCALVRTTTHAHLRATLRRNDVDDVFDWLRQLPYVQEGRHGLFPHDLARDVLAADVRRRDPGRHRELVRTVLRLAGDELCGSPGHPPREAVLDLLHSFRAHSVHNWHWHFGKMGDLRPEPVAADDRDAVLQLISENEGAVNAEIAARWLERQPDGFRLDRDDRGRVESVVGWVSLVDATAEDLAADPAARQLWDHVRRTAPPAPGEQVTVLRFACPANSPVRRSALGLAAYEGVRRVIGQPNLRGGFLVLQQFEWRRPLMEHMGYALIDAFDIEIDGRRYAVFGHDWQVLPASWAVFLDERQWARRRGTGPQDHPAELDRVGFDAAVRQALRDLHRPDALAGNALTRTPLLRDGDAGDPAARLASLLEEAARTLTGHPRDEKLHRALDRTYFRPAPTQEKAAELLGLPLSTYRRHLAQGIARLAGHLWTRVGDPR